MVDHTSKTPSRDTDELGYLTIAELSGLMGAGKLSSKELVNNTLKRISDLDSSGPTLRSVITLNPRAEELAEQLDRERLSGKIRSALHGIPVLIKDNLDTLDMRTTGGSLALVSADTPKSDATAVERLRDAGAVIVGKTNLSEWSGFRGKGSSSGWSGLGGQTLNPYALDRSPGGSSSGSAVAVAAGIVPLALGTETDGSILCPAAFNGIVGVKPTLGLVPTLGAIPISFSQDTIGPLTKGVSDAAIALALIAGPHPKDRHSLSIPKSFSLSQSLDLSSISKLRLGVPRTGFFGYSPKSDKVVEKMLSMISMAGGTVIDPIEQNPTDSIGFSQTDELLVFLSELKVGLNSYLATRTSSEVTNIEDLINFNLSRENEELLFFGQEYLKESLHAPDLDDPLYLGALERNRTRTRSQIDKALAKYSLDALVVPTMGPAWLTDRVNGDTYGGEGYSVAAIAGYPSISIPVGMVDGLPVGVNLFSSPWSESRLLQKAMLIENLLAFETRPTFQASLG